jgi:hypothetical protein
MVSYECGHIPTQHMLAKWKIDTINEKVKNLRLADEIFNNVIGLSILKDYSQTSFRTALTGVSKENTHSSLYIFWEFPGILMLFKCGVNNSIAVISRSLMFLFVVDSDKLNLPLWLPPTTFTSSVSSYCTQQIAPNCLELYRNRHWNSRNQWRCIEYARLRCNYVPSGG